MKVIQEIQLVSNEILKAWNKEDLDGAAFNNIVLEKTKEIDLSDFADLKKTIKLLNDPYVGALQTDNPFSDLYFQPYANQHFQVEVLHWWKSDINIHDHDFSGIQFQISGKSLNVIYDFEENQKMDRACIGKISPRKAEIWNEGNVSVVNPGSVDPHTVFHLTDLTVSLLFRTRAKMFYGPQRNYLPPSLSAEYPFGDSPIFTRYLKALSMMRKHNKIEFKKTLVEYIEQHSPSEVLFLIEKLQHIVFEPDVVDVILEFSSRGEVEKNIVQSIVHRKGYNFLSAKVRNLPCLTENERLSICVLMASHNQETRQKIINDLDFAGKSVDIMGAINKAMEYLDPVDQEKLSKTVKLFGGIK